VSVDVLVLDDRSSEAVAERFPVAVLLRGDQLYWVAG
jgi:hypothetical protein